jgi:hypothetical protein
MLYVDYHWDLSSTTIIPDPEIDTDQLQWQAGDYWQIVEYNGRLILQKVDPIVQFVLEGNQNG